MRRTVLAWLRRRRRLLLRELAVLLCALALGLGCSAWQSDTYLPSIDGNIYSMLALEDSLLMVLSNGNRNSLVRLDHTGTLLNYIDTAGGQAFQYLESDGETVYAILSYEKDGAAFQRLVSLSLQNAAMRPKLLTELTSLPGAPKGVMWREIYLPSEEETTVSIKLAGTDEQGQGYLARWDMETGHVRFEKILPGENILFLKYVADEHYVWISRSKEAGQYRSGIWQRNLLRGLSDTPLHISTCGKRCFISDSVSGDIFELLPDGTTICRRQGEDSIGSSGFQYRQLEVYTTYLEPSGDVRLVGLCAAGQGSVVAGEDWSIRAMHHPVALRLLMLWQHGWPAAMVCWLVLGALVEAVYHILRSPRLSVRLLLCQVIAAVILLTSVTAVQYHSFQETIREEADQKLRLIGRSLAASLSGEDQADGEAPDTAADRLERQISTAMAGYENEYDICVIWSAEHGPVIACDSAAPEGYLLEDVKSREYFTVISRLLLQNGAALERIQTDTSYDYLYAQSFSQAGRTGCVAVSQSESAMLAGQTQFLQRMIPILAACPILFFALASLR